MISYKEKFMFKVNKVHAHCDIPCKVYDPSIAQYAALSVVRLIDIIEPTPQTVEALMKLDLASGVDVEIKI